MKARKGRRWGQEAAVPSPKLARNLLHSSKFSERTIGNSGNSSAYSPLYLIFRAENLQPPPQSLTSSYAHVKALMYRFLNLLDFTSVSPNSLGLGGCLKEDFSSGARI